MPTVFDSADSALQRWRPRIQFGALLRRSGASHLPNRMRSLLRVRVSFDFSGRSRPNYSLSSPTFTYLLRCLSEQIKSPLHWSLGLDIVIMAVCVKSRISYTIEMFPFIDHESQPSSQGGQLVFYEMYNFLFRILDVSCYFQNTIYQFNYFRPKIR